VLTAEHASATEAELESMAFYIQLIPRRTGEGSFDCEESHVSQNKRDMGHPAHFSVIKR